MRTMAVIASAIAPVAAAAMIIPFRMVAVITIRIRAAASVIARAVMPAGARIAVAAVAVKIVTLIIRTAVAPVALEVVARIRTPFLHFMPPGLFMARVALKIAIRMAVRSHKARCRLDRSLSRASQEQGGYRQGICKKEQFVHAVSSVS